MVKIDDETKEGAEGSSLLEALKAARVFSVSRSDDGRFFLEEKCDSYFCAYLTKEQVLTLSDELRALAEGLK